MADYFYRSVFTRKVLMDVTRFYHKLREPWRCDLLNALRLTPQTSCEDIGVALCAMMDFSDLMFLGVLDKCQVFFNAVRCHIGSRRRFLRFVAGVEAKATPVACNPTAVFHLLELVRSQNQFPIYMDATGLVSSFPFKKPQPPVDPAILAPSRFWRVSSADAPYEAEEQRRRRAEARALPPPTDAGM